MPARPARKADGDDMTHRRTRLSVLGALALGACLMITSCGSGSAATAPAVPNPQPSVAPAAVSAASNSAAPVAASTELSTAVTEAAVGGTPDATEVDSVAAAVGATEACFCLLY